MGIHEPPLLEWQDLDNKRSIWRVRLRIPRIIRKLRSLIFYLEWYLRVLFRYRHSRIGNTCLSYYCLPNKIYEYMAAGLAVIVSDFADISAEVERFKNGWRVAVSAQVLLDFVDSLDPADVEEQKRHSLAARVHIGWDSEEGVLLTAYRRLLLPQTQGARS